MEVGTREKIRRITRPLPKQDITRAMSGSGIYAVFVEAAA
jgi:hypothetical protein